MAKEGLSLLVCALALAISAPAGLAANPGQDDKENAVAAALAVQTAMQQGRDLLLENKPRAAVEVLEKELARINGNQNYLVLLRDAYRSYIKQLRLDGKEPLAEVYLRRLYILDPRGSAARAGHAPAPVLPPTAVRAYRDEEDDDPFRSGQAKQADSPRAALARAEEEFKNHRYHEAERLFQTAHRSDPASVERSRERWAYCKLHDVVDRMNQTPAPPYGELEKEIRQALELAPRLDYGKQLLAEVGRRRAGAGFSAAAPARDMPAPQVALRQLGSQGGWSVAETTNFRFYYRQEYQLTEQVARVAEESRARVQVRWFGTTGPTWEPKCEIYLHATRDAYSRETGVPGVSPGHSTSRVENRVISRRIDLHCDEPSMLEAVLPHETTHVVLAGNFGDRPVPRWADEGMAVLTEPREKVERHLRNLPKYQHDQQLFGLGELMQMNDYPDARYVGVFYAQSVSLVEFLANEKGPTVFTAFLIDGLQSGYLAALEKHYGMQNIAELESRWQRSSFGGTNTKNGVARNGL